MTDIESMLLNDIPYLNALDSSESAARALHKKYALPDISVHSVVTFYLKDHGQLKFKYIYQDLIGRHYFSLFCGSRYELLNFLQEIDRYENTTMDHNREMISRQIVDTYIMPDLLANDSLFQKEVTDKVFECLKNGMVTPTLFREIKRNLMLLLEGSKFKEFLKSPEFARYCQWKHIELNIPFSVIKPMQESKPYFCPTCVWSPFVCDRAEMNINDFTILRIIGRGGFGEVYACRKNDTGKLFALKCSDKRRIKLKRCETVPFNERDILSRLSSPFIVNLHYCFHSATTVYHVLDLMNGGDLQFYLNKYSVFAEKVARFYMCEITLGLQHLHDNNIVHRDIKAPNILLDEHGHVKISDFGLAWNYLVKKTSLKVGTVGFMAPEVMKREHYTFTADWYSFGCLCCQLVNCDIPFKPSRSSDKPPEHLSLELLQVIRGLLKEDPKQRLGCRGRGANELKECAFFEGIDWDDAADKKLKPPLIPSKTQVNTANLTSTPNGLNDHDIKDIELNDTDSVRYEDFSRVVSTQWQNEIIGSLFDTVNVIHDKLEAKERQKLSKTRVDYYSPSLTRSDCMLQGVGQKLTTTVRVQHWQRKYFRLYSNRLEWADSYVQLSKSTGAVLSFDGLLLIRETSVKDTKHIVIQKIGERQEYQLKFESAIDHMMWLKLLREISQTASQNMPNSGILTQSAFNSNFVAMRRHRLALKESHSLPFTSTL